MKHKNDTWLGFFKKTLKISGLILIFIIIAFIFLVYKAMTADSKTYLICKHNETGKVSHIAFNNYRLFGKWDPLNEKFNDSYDIIEINKKFIKARAYVNPEDGKLFSDSKSLSLSNEKPSYGFVNELIWELDRETGKLRAYFLSRSEVVDDNRICNKSSKKNFPVTKVKQKF